MVPRGVTVAEIHEVNGHFLQGLDSDPSVYLWFLSV
jgi:hypothetical protein